MMLIKYTLLRTIDELGNHKSKSSMKTIKEMIEGGKSAQEILERVLSEEISVSNAAELSKNLKKKLVDFRNKIKHPKISNSEIEQKVQGAEEKLKDVNKIYADDASKRRLYKSYYEKKIRLAKEELNNRSSQV